MREMGLEQAKFSSLRDTFAVNALNYGIDIKTVAYTLGTKSVRGITKRYLPLVEKKKRQAAERLEEKMNSILSD
jgi:integrase